VADDRQRLGRGFDSAADLYQQARPEYPEPLYDTLVEVAGVRVGDRLLEVGCATGKATLPLARRGFGITCVEIGPNLAAVARSNLAAFPFVEVMSGAFETWQPLPAIGLISSSRPRPGTGSTRRCATSEPGSCCVPPATSPCGLPPTSSPKAVTRSSPRSRTSMKRSARGCPRACPCCDPVASPTIARDRGKRPVRGRGCSLLRLGDQLQRRGVPPSARHVLWPHRHAAMATRAPLRGDQAAPRTAVERSTASSLGSGPTRRPPSRSNTRLIKGILDRDTTVAAPGSVCRPVQREGEEIAVRVRGVVAERRAGDESVAHV